MPGGALQERTRSRTRGRIGGLGLAPSALFLALASLGLETSACEIVNEEAAASLETPTDSFLCDWDGSADCDEQMDGSQAFLSGFEGSLSIPRHLFVRTHANAAAQGVDADSFYELEVRAGLEGCSVSFDEFDAGEIGEAFQLATLEVDGVFVAMEVSPFSGLPFLHADLVDGETAILTLEARATTLVGDVGNATLFGQVLVVPEPGAAPSLVAVLAAFVFLRRRLGANAAHQVSLGRPVGATL